MKRLLFLIIPVALSLLTAHADALLVAETPLELYYHHELILVGKVVSLIENPDGITIQYNIKVEEYVKNTKPYDVINVIGRYFSIPSSPKFDVGDRVLLLLNKDDSGRYEISPLSFKAKLGCDAHQMLGMQTFPDEPLARGQPHEDFQIDENCLGPVEKPSGVWFVSPLKQFKSGIPSQAITCQQGLQSIMKINDGSPACVKPETKLKLIERGWGTSSDLQTSGIVPNSFMNCQTPYPKTSDGIAVLYMPTNSIGKICVRYSNLNDFITPVGIRIFEANNLTQNASEIRTWASGNTIQEGNATIVYTIKTRNHAGFYGLSLFCGGMPFAVGYDNNSRIVADDFPWVDRVFHCPAQTYEFHIEGIEGIGIKYISHSSIFPR